MDSLHKCKLCSRSFSNGRALGGHMKAHLASLPLPKRHERLANVSLSSSSSSSDEESEEKAMVYELRENPKKSFRFVDHGGFDIVVQDGESETESRNPTRKRSKRNRKKLSPEPASSVSDTSPEEHVAMCLMMLSRDKWIENKKRDRSPKIEEESRSFEELGKMKVKKVIRRKKKCEKCLKQFRSYRALFSHEKICRDEEDEGEGESFENGGKRRIFKCPFCFKLFGSGQALGGHKRSHLLSSTNTVSVNGSESMKLEISLIDLNLPAPVEEDDYSVVSDA